MPAVTTTSLDSVVAGGSSAAEGGPSAAPGRANLDDDDAELDDVGQALTLILPPVEPSPPTLICETPGDGEPLGAGEPGSTPPAAVATPAPAAAPALASSPATSPAAIAARPSPPAAPPYVPDAGDGDRAGAGAASAPREILEPGSTPPTAEATLAPAAPALASSPSAPSTAARPARPSPPSVPTDASRPPPASLQFVGSVSGAVPQSGPGSHQRASNLSPARLAACVASGSPAQHGRRGVTLGELARPVSSIVEQRYFFENVDCFSTGGGKTNWVAFGAAWNTEATLRNSNATSASDDSDTWFHFTTAGHLHDFQKKVLKEAAVLGATREAAIMMAANSGAAGAASASDAHGRGTKRPSSATAGPPTTTDPPSSASGASAAKSRRRQLASVATARTAAAASPPPPLSTGAPISQPAGGAIAGTLSAGPALPSAVVAPPFLPFYPGMQHTWPPNFQWPPPGFLPTSSGPTPQLPSQAPRPYALPDHSSKKRGAPDVPKRCSRCNRLLGGAKRLGFIHLPIVKGEPAATSRFCTKDGVNLSREPLTGDSDEAAQ